MFGFMDAIENSVTPENLRHVATGEKYVAVYWMQMLNLGYRITGVVNTDAHQNFHGSGWLRNFVKSPADSPARIKTMDIVHEVEKGHVVVTNGPFMEVELKPFPGSAALILP